MAYQSEVVAKVTAKTEGTESVKSLKTQIREAVQEAAQMTQKFGEFSPEALKAAQRVANLKDQMDDLNEKIQALHPDKFNRINTIAQGVANGFQAAQGAMALFGAESEDVQKALLKVQGAMALAQGLEGLDAAGKQLKTLGQAAVSAFQSMTTASKAFLATGLGLIVAAIGYAVANFDQLAEAMGFAESEMQKMNKAMNIAAAETKQQAADLNYYNSVVQDTNKSEGERLFALQKLKEAGIATDDVNIANANSLQALNDRVAKQIVLIAQRARTEAAAQILQEKTKKLIEMQNGDLDDQITLWDRFAEASKAAASAGLYRQDLQSRANENIKKTQEDVNKATAVYQKELEKSTKLEGVSVETSKQVTSTLKKQKEATKDLHQAELERNATMLALDQSTLEAQIKAADAAFAVKVKSLKDNGYTEKQIATLRDAELEKVRTAFYVKQKSDIDKANKEREQQVKEAQDKEIADAQKFTEDYFKAQQTAYIQRNATADEFAALELQRLEAQLQNAKDYGQSTVDLELQIAAKKKEIYDKDAADKKAAEEAKIDVQEKILQATYDSLAALQGILKEGSDAAKAAALLDIAIKTGVGFAQGLDIAQKGAAGTGPAAPYAFPVFYAQQVAAVLGAVSRAKAILKGGGSGGAGGGGGRVSVPSAPALAPITGGALPDEQQFGGMGRVYVLEGDITKTQTRVRRLRNTSVV